MHTSNQKALCDAEGTLLWQSREPGRATHPAFQQIAITPVTLPDGHLPHDTDTMDDLVVGVDRDEKGFFWLSFTVTDPVVGTHQKFESPLGPYYTEDEAWEAAESLVHADSEEE